MPYFICPNCKERSIDHDRREGLTQEAVACHHCGFGFLFELLEDYYPAPGTGFVVCDQQGRVLAAGRDVFELSGLREQDLMGLDVVESLGLTGNDVGVRRLIAPSRPYRASAPTAPATAMPTTVRISAA